MTATHETGERPGPLREPVREVPGSDEAAELNRREEFQLAIETATVTLDQVVEANFGRFHSGPSFYGDLYRTRCFMRAVGRSPRRRVEGCR